MTKATDRNSDDHASVGKKLEDLYELIEGIEIAMFTTRRPDGHLVSRPMATQTQAQGTDLWFVTDIDTHKLDELDFDPHVNLAVLSRPHPRVGLGERNRDRQPRSARNPGTLPAGLEGVVRGRGGERNGGPDDPRIALILVDVHSVTYLKVDKPKPLVLFEVAKEW